MPHPLDDARFKIDWAEEHIARLNATTAPWAVPGNKENPYTLTAKLNPNTGWTEWHAVIRDGADDPEPRLVSMIFDIGNSLRAALEYTAQQLAGSSANKQTGFPIVSKPDDWKGECARKLVGIDGFWINQIEAFQPYYRHKSGRALLALATLNNWDKHHAPHVLVLNGPGEWDGELDFGQSLVSQDITVDLSIRNEGPVVSEEPVLRMRFINAFTGLPLDREVKVKTKYAPAVRVDHTTAFEGDFSDLAATIREVVETFARAFP